MSHLVWLKLSYELSHTSMTDNDININNKKVITNVFTPSLLSVFSRLELNLQIGPILYHWLCKLVTSQDKTGLCCQFYLYGPWVCNTDLIPFVVLIIETISILCVPLIFFSSVPVTNYGASGP